MPTTHCLPPICLEYSAFMCLEEWHQELGAKKRVFDGLRFKGTVAANNSEDEINP